MTFDGSQKVIGKGARAFRFVHQADAGNTSIPPLASTAGSWYFRGRFF